MKTSPRTPGRGRGCNRSTIRHHSFHCTASAICCQVFHWMQALGQLVGILSYLIFHSGGYLLTMYTRWRGPLHCQLFFLSISTHLTCPLLLSISNQAWRFAQYLHLLQAYGVDRSTYERAMSPRSAAMTTLIKQEALDTSLISTEAPSIKP